MTLNTETISQKARELALQHNPRSAGSSSRRIWKSFQHDVDRLRSFVTYLQNQKAGCSQPAEEWLLDNAEFIEEQAITIRQQLRGSLLKRLPILDKSGELRIEALCAEFVELTQEVPDIEALLAFLNAYQEISVLTIAETWAVPIVLRIVLIRRLAEVMQSVRERREVCVHVGQFLSRMEPQKINTEALRAALDKEDQHIPLSGPWIVHLISHLREWADDAAIVREWLLCKLENGPESLDNIMMYEHRLQADYQLKAGNLITGIRKVERLDWRDSFEHISLVERTLESEQEGDYLKLDYASRDSLRSRVELLARSWRVPENLVAATAVQLADSSGRVKSEMSKPDGSAEQKGNSSDSADRPRQTFIAYYLLDPKGMNELHGALKLCSETGGGGMSGFGKMRSERRAPAAFFTWMGVMFVLLLAAMLLWLGFGTGMLPWQWAVAALLLIFPASEWSSAVAQWMLGKAMKPKPLLRYDYSNGIPEDAATMVVIPVIWSSPEDVKDMADRLEIHYLANRSPNLYFALLGDFPDADTETLPIDADIIAAGKAAMNSLNRKYAQEGKPGFFLFHRGRTWNASEKVWMGWERKRGKLTEFVELLRGQTRTGYVYAEGDVSLYSAIRYVITLDADTQLPMGAAQRMVGTMHLPYNRPRLNKAQTRVVEGYGVLQPRIAMSHDSAMRSRLAYWSSGTPGIDCYSSAVSDTYQDGFGHSIFMGKGIFDVDMFMQVLGDRIPDNRVLSHDLLEGGFLRAGLLADIEMVDEHPATFVTYQKRLHRWVRGDWQLLGWLLPRYGNRNGVSEPVDLPAVTRWQMIDNLRRSLLYPALLASIALSLTLVAGGMCRLLAIVLITLLLPAIRQMLSSVTGFWNPRATGSALWLAAVAILTLPYQSALLLHAVGVTVYRLWVTKRHLLEWVSSNEAERQSRGHGQKTMLGLRGGYALLLIVAVIALLHWGTAGSATGLALSVLWAVVPPAIRWLDQPIGMNAVVFSPEAERQLKALAKQIWAYYEDFSGKEDNWLPPDNVQIEPPNGVAHRTSPTNIGFLLACTVSARDFGFIDTPGMIERLGRTLGTVERMEKWNGHLLNWYDTVSLAPLPPKYVSTVDSGNFVACLMAVKQGVAEWLRKDLERHRNTGSADLEVASAKPDGLSEEANADSGTAKKARARTAVEFAKADELSADTAVSDGPAAGVAGWGELELPGSAVVQADEEEPSMGAEKRTDKEIHHYTTEQLDAWLEKGNELLHRLESLIQGTDFRALYDDKAKLFSLGYHLDSEKRDSIVYDLLASEARQASFVAIALGQISVSHWFVLGRTMTKIGRNAALLSWTGTMFEYMMPWLLMRTYRGSIWDRTFRGVVDRHIEYARKLDIPFGISESGYYAFDFQMNYQYRAFGVPGLGFKRGLEQDAVVSPYATIMALPYAPVPALGSLQRMEKLGARGPYGFYEAIDFTPRRMPHDRTYVVIRSFMAHHQGMSMLTLANLLLPGSMVDRFHNDKRVRAAEMLLTERMPDRPAIIGKLATVQERTRELGENQAIPVREIPSAITPTPEICVLSNGVYMTTVTNSGSGFSQYEGLAVTRWREDSVLDDWGSYIYIRDVSRDELWSPAYMPCRVRSADEQIRFSPERAVFTRKHNEIETAYEICVSAECNGEVRRLTLANSGHEPRIIEVTTFSELVLASSISDDSHPAFSKLFVETEYSHEFECLLAKRRTRDEAEKPLWAVHALAVPDGYLGPVEFETDRACFIGRGYTRAEPKGIRSRLNGTVGAVVDPAFIMRRRVTVKPGERVQLIAVTGAAGTKEEAIGIVRRLTQEQQAARAFQLAWTRSQIEFRHLRLTAADAFVYQSLAARAMYTAPLRSLREQSIAANTHGQPGLWAHGVSGDRPIVLVRVTDSSDLPFVLKVIRGFDYLRRKSLQLDLIILNESTEGYQQNVHESLQRAAEQQIELHGYAAKYGGLHIVAASRLSADELTLLFAVARVVLKAGGPSVRSQLRVSRPVIELSSPLPANGNEQGIKHGSMNEALPDTTELYLFNGWGGFANGGSEYRIVLKNGHHLPAPWVNVFANPRFGALASELYTGYTWWRNSREFKLTPWSNDPVLDQAGELCYLRDEDTGQSWTVTPTRGHNEHVHTITHGQGYTRYVHESRGIAQEMTVFVAREDPIKLIRLNLENLTKVRRTLSVTYFADWVLGVRREGRSSFIVTDWDEQAEAMFAHNTFQEAFRDAVAFLAVVADSADQERTAAELSWTADREEFFGRLGKADYPAAMRRRRLSGRTGVMYDTCGAVRSRFTVEPGETRTVMIMLGCEQSREEAVKLLNAYRHQEACERALGDVRKFWEDFTGQITVSTPSQEMNILLNHWLLYQSLSCRIWARTAFYQAGGAFGFRDQLQDALSLLHVRPDLTRAQILLHASHQYVEGDVQHWWHRETERGIRTRFSDDLLWLPYSVSRYVEQTGDETVWNEIAPYLISDPLEENNHERYEQTVLSDQSGTLYDHCLRAIERSLRFGEHGLPLIGIGDWNDGLNRVGDEGRGETVWLGWFLCDILQRFTDVCERRGDAERADRYRNVRGQLAEALDQHAWDGQWYRRAYTDNGSWLGSIHNEECRIDAIAQSWSVISGAAPRDKAMRAMQSFDRELVDRNLNVIRLLTPAFDKTKPSPGYIQGYPPGIRENGAQYTHGVIWGIIAWCRLGEGDKAFELFDMMNPMTHTRTPGEVRRYVGEPYVIAADVYTSEPHKGHAGWTWYTGAAGWMYQAGIESILGITRRVDKLYIRPCIPREWPEFTAAYRFGRSMYRIHVLNPDRKSSGCSSLSLDGRMLDPEQFGAEGTREPFVNLIDDGKNHDVQLTL